MKYQRYLNGIALLRLSIIARKKFSARQRTIRLLHRIFNSGAPQRSAKYYVAVQMPRPVTGIVLTLATIITLLTAPLASGQSLNSILSQAQNAKAPGSGQFKPNENVHPFGTSNSTTSLAVRTGIVTLSNGKVLSGQVWTTLKTPFRVWLADIKQYRDIDIRLIKTIQVRVLKAKEIRDWRYQQEGSDIKNYSGKARPRISFAYRFTTLHGKAITGTLDAPLFVRVGGHTFNLILYKRVEGKLGEKLSSVVYVKSVTLKVTPSLVHYAAGLTRKLPLLHWRKLLAGISAAPSSGARH